MSVEYDADLSNASDDESDVVDEAERLLDRLAAPAAAWAADVTRHCCENAFLRLRLRCSMLQREVLALRETVLRVVHEQQSLMAPLAAGRMRIDLAPQHCYVERVEPLAEQAVAVVLEWLRVRPFIRHNRWLSSQAVLLNEFYLDQTRLVAAHLNCVAVMLRTLVETGLVVLSKLEPTQLSEGMLINITSGLDEYNMLLQSLKSLSSHDDSSFLGHVAADFTLESVLQALATSNGADLAGALKPYVDACCHAIRADIAESVSDAVLVKWLAGDEAVGQVAARPQKPAPNYELTADATSDYFSGSASSTRTDALPAMDEGRVALRRVYTAFLEQRYTVFVALVDASSAFRSLTTDQSLKRGRVPHAVRWLDDCLKNQRRRMWKRFVRRVWSACQARLVDRVRAADGPWRLLSNADQLCVFRSLNMVLQAVPLPEKLASPKEALDALQSDASIVIVSRAVSHLCSSEAVADLDVSTKTADSRHLLQSDAAAFELVRQFDLCQFQTTCIQHIAQYNIKDLMQLIAQSPVHDYKEQISGLLGDKVSTVSRAVMRSTMPQRRYWLMGGEANKAHTDCLLAAIIGPFLVERCDSAVEQATQRFVAAFVDYFFDETLKLSGGGFGKLDEHLDQIADWLRERRALSDATAAQLVAQQRRVRRVRRASVVTFRRRTAVAPDDAAASTADRSPPDWATLRVRGFGSASAACCSCFNSR